MDNKTVGAAIKAGRIAKGETQAIMGAKLGVMQQHVSAWERGRRTVPKTVRRALTKNYGVAFEEPKPEIIADRGERRLQAPDRRNDKMIRCIPIVERMFIEELKNFLDAVTVALCGTVRRRRGRIVRGRLRT